MAGSVMLVTQYGFICIMIEVPEVVMGNSIAMLQTILEMQKCYEAKNSKCQHSTVEWFNDQYNREAHTFSQISNDIKDKNSDPIEKYIVVYAVQPLVTMLARDNETYLVVEYTVSGC